MNLVRTDTENGKRPRGRPRAFDPEVVLGKIYLVFAEKGFSAASLDDLAAASGLNRPSLYAAFGSKEQLYILTIQRTTTRALAGLNLALALPLPIHARLKIIFEKTVEAYTAPPHHTGCLIVGTATAEAPTRPDIAAAALAHLAAIRLAFETAFTRAAEAGEIAPQPSPQSRAHMASAILDSLAIRARLGAPASVLTAFARETVEAICGPDPEATN